MKGEERSEHLLMEGGAKGRGVRELGVGELGKCVVCVFTVM